MKFYMIFLGCMSNLMLEKGSVHTERPCSRCEIRYGGALQLKKTLQMSQQKWVEVINFDFLWIHGPKGSFIKDVREKLDFY